VIVDISNVNEAPAFVGTLGDVPVTSGQSLELLLNSLVNDPENGDFQISVFDADGGLPSFVEYDPETRTLSAVPSILDQGVYQLTVRAFELGSTAVNDLSFSINVQRGDQPFTNRRNRADVDNNKLVAPSDVLRVINFLAEFGESSVANNTNFPGFIDVSGDGIITPLDILLVINELAEQAVSSAQGEAIDILDASREEAVDEAMLHLDEANLF
jgi:hypothetical protein